MAKAKRTAKAPAKKTYFNTFFTVGVLFFFIGMTGGAQILWVLGLAFIAIGFANKDKWAAEGCKFDAKTAAIALIVGLAIALAIAFFRN